jgi:hypothetical protein
MGTLLRLISCVAIVGLLGSSLFAETVIFSDDFESGNLNLWTFPGANQLNISTAQNRIPVGGLYSAQIDSSGDRMYHNLGSEVSGQILFTTYLFDDTQTRAFTEIRAYSGAGYADGTLQQLLAIGKYNSVNMTGEVYTATKYQGRLTYGSTAGWFNLNGPGSPNRSAGWHKFDIEILPSGTDVNFYLDGVLSRSFSGATLATYDTVVVGLGAGSTAGNAWVDGMSLAIVPEPGAIVLLASGLAALAVLALSRARRRSA